MKLTPEGRAELRRLAEAGAAIAGATFIALLDVAEVCAAAIQAQERLIDGDAAEAQYEEAYVAEARALAALRAVGWTP